MVALSKLAEKRLSLSEASGKVGVTPVTVWRWITLGVRGKKLPALRIGSRRYVFVSDLENFIAAENAEADGPEVAHG